MIVYIFSGLVTARIVLSNLGVSDFGIYNIVGSVVTTLGFLHSSLTGATNRFLSASLVKNSNEDKKLTFTTALVIHVLLALFVGILLETVGVNFLVNNVKIPLDRIGEALTVYHLSSVSAVLILMYIPFEAAIIANEKMEMLAKVSISEALLKLLFSFTIGIFAIDNLVYYGYYLLLITLMIRLVSMFYCIRLFNECRVIFKIDKKLAKEIFNFFSLDLFGNASVMLKTTGVSILQNNFFGVVINAAENISQQVNSALTILSNGFFSAVKPQIFKSYAEGDFDRFYQLLFVSARYSCYMVALIGFPIFFGVDYILDLWLTNIPQYADGLIRICVLGAIVSSFNMPVISAIHATGKIAKLSFISGGLFLFTLPLSYLFLYVFNNPYSSGIVIIAVNFIVMVTNCKILKSLMPSFFIYHYLKIVIKNISILGAIFFIEWGGGSILSIGSLFDFLLFSSFCMAIILVSVYGVVCEPFERDILRNYLAKPYRYLKGKL